MKDPDNMRYHTPRLIVTAIAFLVLWAYAVDTYGWFLGGGLGWIPALFLAILLGFLWPIVAVGIVILLVMLVSQLPAEDIESTVIFVVVVGGLLGLYFGLPRLVNYLRRRPPK
jgi:hypothetical protein